MPRAKKQYLDAPQDSHGERKELMDAQRNFAPAPSAPALPQGQATMPPAQAEPPALSQAEVLALAETAMPQRGTGLAEFSQRPNESIMTPAPMSMRDQLGRTSELLNRLALETDDPSFFLMAQEMASRLQ